MCVVCACESASRVGPSSYFKVVESLVQDAYKGGKFSTSGRWKLCDCPAYQSCNHIGLEVPRWTDAPREKPGHSKTFDLLPLRLALRVPGFCFSHRSDKRALHDVIQCLDARVKREPIMEVTYLSANRR